MLSFLAKAAFGGLTIALVATLARRHPGWGGLLAALPLTSLLAFVLLWRDTHDADKVAQLSTSVLAYVVPSLPFFIALPMMLRAGLGFWPAMALGLVLLLALYAASFALLARLGVAA